MREELIHHAELRDQVKRIMDRLKMPMVFPEEVVHYSEWVHVMRREIAARKVLDLSDLNHRELAALYEYAQRRSRQSDADGETVEEAEDVKTQRPSA